MKKISKLFMFAVSLLFIAPLAGGLLTSCDGDETSSLADSNDPIATPLTDSLAFPYADDYMDKDFAEPNKTGIVYGRVTLTYATDGDTANFRTAGSATKIRTRFLGINTPESTAKVEPWGVKASKFAAEKLTNAKDICLVNDVLTSPTDTLGYERTETNGRYLTFVWYLTQDDQWRLLNLELIEQCYTQNQLFVDSDLGYLNYFLEAGEKAKATHIRVNGTRDPDFDYSDKADEVTINYVRTNFDKLGIDPETGSSGTRLRVTGLVVGMIGDNMVLRDTTKGLEQTDEDPYDTIYAFVGYNTGLASMVGVGDVVRFYCRASIYPKDTTNVQLTDVKTDTWGDEKFEVAMKHDDPAWVEEYGHIGTDVIVPETNPADKEELASHNAQFVQLDITVRLTEKGEFDENGEFVGTGEESYFNYSENNGLTIYAYLKDTRTVCNLRIDANCSPKLNENDFQVDKSYRVQGYLQPYFDNYQLQMFNYTNPEYRVAL
jgi:endonuclease YncB( thermonuclease family)